MKKIKYDSCMIKDCSKAHMSKGLCNRHYQQLYKHGRIMPNEQKLDNLPNELWCDIEDAEGFAVSSRGRVKTNTGIEKLVTPQIETRKRNHTPRQRVYLDRRAKLGWVKYLYVHVEVAKCFVENKTDSNKVIFKDGDTLNCEAVNLVWFWDEPPMYPENLTLLKETAATDAGLAVVKFIDGDRSALNSLIISMQPRLRGKLNYMFGQNHQDKIDDAVQYAISEGVQRITRGMLKNDENIPGYFATIAIYKMFDDIKKDAPLVSEFFDHNGSEFSRFDSVARAN